MQQPRGALLDPALVPQQELDHPVVAPLSGPVRCPGNAGWCVGPVPQQQCADWQMPLFSSVHKRVAENGVRLSTSKQQHAADVLITPLCSTGQRPVQALSRETAVLQQSLAHPEVTLVSRHHERNAA